MVLKQETDLQHQIILSTTVEKAQDVAYMRWGVGMSSTATFEGSFQMWLYNPLRTSAFKNYQWRYQYPSDRWCS